MLRFFSAIVSEMKIISYETIGLMENLGYTADDTFSSL